MTTFNTFWKIVKKSSVQYVHITEKMQNVISEIFWNNIIFIHLRQKVICFLKRIWIVG